jgi:hypothetical protein
MANAESTIRVAPESPERPGGIIDLDQVESPIVRAGIGYWRRLCGERKYPERTAISPSEIRGLLRNTVLIRVVDAGADFDYRIVGDAHVIAYGFSMQGKLLSEMEEYAPGHAPVLKSFYSSVVRRRTPFALRGWLERGQIQKQFIYTESVFMPLGVDDEVDHVLNFSVYVPRTMDS